MTSNKIAVFIDYDNIMLNMKTEPPERLSEELGYQRMMSWIAKYGEISLVFVFAPAITIAARIEFFHKLGFIPIACPVFRTTKKESPSILGGDDFGDYEPGETILINKTDDVMIDVAKRTIELMPDISHVCIASADADFTPIANLVEQIGKKLMIVISSLRASKKFLTLANRGENNKRMLHLFDPIRE